MSWKNLPIPETIVFPLAVGFIIDNFFPNQLLQANVIWFGLAMIFLIFGLSWMIWSVREAGTSEMESADKLITTGPYSFGRNPMYLSWISVYLGFFFLNKSSWLLLMLFVAVLSTHYLAILKEENDLRQSFGVQFDEYCKKVRRYI